jgi:hypothetical protein
MRIQKQPKPSSPSNPIAELSSPSKRETKSPASCLYNTRRGWTPPLRREAAPLGRCSPSTAMTTLGHACCAGHHPSCPFTLSGSSVGQTRHLALDPSSVLYLQHKLCSYLDALQHLPPPQPVPRQLLPFYNIIMGSLDFFSSWHAYFKVLVLRCGRNSGPHFCGTQRPRSLNAHVQVQAQAGSHRPCT